MLTGGLAACATTAPAATAGCDRACLGETLQSYLDSLLAHDPSLLPMTADVRFTEDGVEHAPGEGFWGAATGLRDLRLEVLDPTLSTAVGLAVMEEGEQMVLLAFRLKVEGRVVSEVETLVVKPQGENALVNRDTLAHPRAEILVGVPPELANTREEIIEIAQHYPDGLKAGSFVAVDAPFAPGARRLENGMVLAGPDCTLNENCRDMKTQPSPTRPTLTQRLLAVDEETGVAFYWLSWIQQATGNWLVVWEAFKVYDDQIWAVEAFLETSDPTIGSGWGDHAPTAP
jgi:hypothetical protein